MSFTPQLFRLTWKILNKRILLLIMHHVSLLAFTIVILQLSQRIALGFEFDLAPGKSTNFAPGNSINQFSGSNFAEDEVRFQDFILIVKIFDIFKISKCYGKIRSRNVRRQRIVLIITQLKLECPAIFLLLIYPLHLSPNLFP